MPGYCLYVSSGAFRFACGFSTVRLAEQTCAYQVLSECRDFSPQFIVQEIVLHDHSDIFHPIFSEFAFDSDPVSTVLGGY